MDITKLKRYFNTVLLVDDELPLGRSFKAASLDTPSGHNSASVRPIQVFRAFQEKGMCVTPFGFGTMDDVERIAALVSSTKLTILDWHLDGEESNLAAVNIIKRVLQSEDRGLCWIVVYTKADLDVAATELLQELTVIDNDAIRTAAVDAQQRFVDPRVEGLPLNLNGLFVTFTSKKLTPDELLEELGATLDREYGPVALTVLDLIVQIEAHASQKVREFARPFDLSLYLHALTSGLTDQELTPFLYRLFLDALKEGTLNSMNPSNPKLDRLRALEKLRVVYAEQPNEIDDFFEHLTLDPHFRPLRLVESWEQLMTDLTALGSIATLERKLDSLDMYVKKANAEIARLPLPTTRLLRVALEFLFGFCHWRLQFPDAQIHEFFSGVRQQSQEFTRLLQFEPSARDMEVETGAIYYHQETARYYLCVTPYCDTAHPKKVDNRFKFLVGYAEKPTSSLIEVHKRSHGAHGTFLPDDDAGGLLYVVWRFGHDETMVLDPKFKKWIREGCTITALKHDGFQEPITDFPVSVQRALLSLCDEQGIDSDHWIRKLLSRVTPLPEDARTHLKGWIDRALPPHFKFVAKFKKEYIQQIINELLAYHSRAGVSEPSVKEWPGELLGSGTDLALLSSEWTRMSTEYKLTSDQFSAIVEQGVQQHFESTAKLCTNLQEQKQMVDWYFVVAMARKYELPSPEITFALFQGVPGYPATPEQIIKVIAKLKGTESVPDVHRLVQSNVIKEQLDQRLKEKPDLTEEEAVALLNASGGTEDQQLIVHLYSVRTRGQRHGAN